MLNLIDLSLYLVLDPELCGGPAEMVRTARLAAKNGATVVQLRAPDWKKRQWLETAVQLKAALAPLAVPLIINDHVDIALAVDADGVHLGGTDGDLAAARAALGPGRVLGASCYADFALARAAKAAGADYGAFGAVCASPTKPQAGRASWDLLTRARDELAVPVCAIGGITLADAPGLVAAGADLLAVITALFSTPDLAARAELGVPICAIGGISLPMRRASPPPAPICWR